MKCSSNTDIDRSYIAWNAWHAARLEFPHWPNSRQCKPMLVFIWRNIKTKMPKVRETAYNTLVWPQLEYASAVWDPHTKVRISQIEQVQRRATRWTVSNFDRQVSVTRIDEDLKLLKISDGKHWNKDRRADARLCLFYKVIHGLVSVPLPVGSCHSMTFRQVCTSRDYY